MCLTATTKGVPRRGEVSVLMRFLLIDTSTRFMHDATTSRKLFMLRTSAVATTISLSLLALAGCKTSDPQATDLKSLTSNLTPELENTAERPVDVDVNWALNANQDLRSANNDLGRFWLTDQPSRLSPFPITPMNGQP
jgi:hypothetical protein